MSIADIGGALCIYIKTLAQVLPTGQCVVQSGWGRPTYRYCMVFIKFIIINHLPDTSWRLPYLDQIFSATECLLFYLDQISSSQQLCFSISTRYSRPSMFAFLSGPNLPDPARLLPYLYLISPSQHVCFPISTRSPRTSMFASRSLPDPPIPACLPPYLDQISPSQHVCFLILTGSSRPSMFASLYLPDLPVPAIVPYLMLEVQAVWGWVGVVVAGEVEVGALSHSGAVQGSTHAQLHLRGIWGQRRRRLEHRQRSVLLRP